MLLINSHAKDIIERTVTDKAGQHNYELEVAWNYDFVSIRAHVPPQEGAHHGFQRYVVITAEKDNQFQVKFTEVSLNPAFKTQEEARTFDSRKDVAAACRLVYAHINGKVNPKLIPPEKYVDKWTEINDRWLKGSSFHVTLFLQGSEWGDDWRFRINHVSGQEVIGSLDPATADGHTYSMMTKVAQEFFDRGVIEGEVRAAERLAKTMFADIIEGSEHAQWKYPKDVQALLSNISIRNNPTTI